MARSEEGSQGDAVFSPSRPVCWEESKGWVPVPCVMGMLPMGGCLLGTLGPINRWVQRLECRSVGVVWSSG